MNVSGGQKCGTQAAAEGDTGRIRTLLDQRGTIVGAGEAGEQRCVADGLMRMHQQAGAAHEHEHDAVAAALTVVATAVAIEPVSAMEGDTGKAQEHQRQRDACAARQTHRIVLRDESLQQSGERRRYPVEQRAVVGVILAREPRQQPVAMAGEDLRDAYAYRVVVFPGIVAEQAGQQPNRNQDQQGMRASGSAMRKRPYWMASTVGRGLRTSAGQLALGAISCSSKPLIDAHSRSKISLSRGNRGCVALITGPALF